MAEFEYKSYGNVENPQNLLIFIHGYKSSMEAVAEEAERLSNIVPQMVVVTPQSDKFHKNSDIREWYDVSLYDTEHKRRNPQTPLNEIVDIYNRAGEDLSFQAPRLNAFIDQMQHLYGIDDAHTYIAGFSQGATFAIYAGLYRRTEVGAVFALSGIVAGKDSLEKTLHSRPSVYMLHGKSDRIVQYKTLDFSMQWLKQHKVPAQAVIFDDLEHYIRGDELAFIAEVIKKAHPA